MLLKHQVETGKIDVKEDKGIYCLGCRPSYSSGLPMAESQVPVRAAMSHAGPGPGPLL